MGAGAREPPGPLHLLHGRALPDGAGTDGAAGTGGASLPRGFALYSPEGTYETRALRGWLAAQAEGIGAKFDARNGTDRFLRLLTRAKQLGDEAVSFPIDAPPPS